MPEGFSAYDQDAWIIKLKSYIQSTTNKYPSVKWVGICFGHQIIAEALGGKVEKNPKGWEVGWTELTLNEQGLSAFGKDRPQFCIHQMHQDEVTKLPPGFINLATTAHSTHQLMLKPGHVISIQSHPEFTSGVVKQLIQSRRERQVFSDEQAHRWLSVVDNPVDGVWFITKVIQFIQAPLLST
jgi:GMP synthase (glutamine-hydrolysing)